MGPYAPVGAQSEVVVSRLLGTGLMQTQGQFCYVQATADDLPIIAVTAARGIEPPNASDTIRRSAALTTRV